MRRRLQMRMALALAAWVFLACAGLRASPPQGEQASEVLRRFLGAADAGDFKTAYSLLAGSWRAVYSPQRLREDFLQEPLAGERLRRAQAALIQGPNLRGELAEFPVGEGKSVRLVKEEGAYRVASLE